MESSQWQQQTTNQKEEQASSSQPDPSKLLPENFPEKREQTMVLRNFQDVQKMFDSAHILQGMKSSEQIRSDMKKEEEEGNKGPDIHKTKICIPDTFFKDFTPVLESNERDFEYISSQILLTYTETHNNRALEFPSCIGTLGR